MKCLLTLTLFLGIAWGQSELMGLWIKNYDCSYGTFKIYKSNGKQFMEYNSFTKASCKESLLAGIDSPKTYILYNPWFGESYYESDWFNNKEGKWEKVMIEVILIDRNTILIGKTKYNRQ